jgi:hypothetical protein
MDAPSVTLPYTLLLDKLPTRLCPHLSKIPLPGALLDQSLMVTHSGVHFIHGE